MSNETFLTLVGTVVADPELRFVPSGAAVANFTVAVNARKFNKQSNEWEKRPAKFHRCQAWNQGKALLADNITNSLKKGDTVVVYGELETREYTTKEGEKRSADEVRVEAIGKDLRWHQAYANDIPATNTQQGQSWGGDAPQAASSGTWGGSLPGGVSDWGNGGASNGEVAF